MDVVKAVAVVGVIAAATQNMLKLMRAVRAANRPKPEGVTIVNGEYKSLMRSIEGIQTRQDSHKRALDHLGDRIDGLEQRLST